MQLSGLFRKLAAAARSSDHRVFKMSAAVVIGNQVYIGTNRCGDYTHPRSPHPYHAIHCEYAAVKKAIANGQDVRKATVYVLRLTRHGRTGLARPCGLCWSFLKNFGIKTVYYTTKYEVVSERVK